MTQANDGGAGREGKYGNQQKKRSDLTRLWGIKQGSDPHIDSGKKDQHQYRDVGEKNGNARLDKNFIWKPEVPSDTFSSSRRTGFEALDMKKYFVVGGGLLVTR